MEICKMLTLSTAHITKETANTLKERSAHWADYDLVIYDKDTFGWWIHISEEGTEDLHSVPADLVACINFALDNGCEWLCIDCDGPIEESLPIYEWEE